MKKLYLLLLPALFATCCLGDDFKLVDPETKKEYGPFKFLNKETVKIGDKKLVIKKIDQKAIITDRLKKTIINSLEFREVNIKDVVNFLVEESINASQDGVGINLVMRLDQPARQGLFAPPEFEPGDDPFDFDDGGLDLDLGGGLVEELPDPDSSVRTLTINLRRVSLYDAIDLICQVSDLQWEITNMGISIKPKDPKPEKQKKADKKETP